MTPSSALFTVNRSHTSSLNLQYRSSRSSRAIDRIWYGNKVHLGRSWPIVLAVTISRGWNSYNQLGITDGAVNHTKSDFSLEVPCPVWPGFKTPGTIIRHQNFLCPASTVQCQSLLIETLMTMYQDSYQPRISRRMGDQPSSYKNLRRLLYSPTILDK